MDTLSEIKRLAEQLGSRREVELAVEALRERRDALPVEKLPWKGNRGPLKLEQVDFFKRLHAIHPIKKVECGKWGAVYVTFQEHIEGMSYRRKGRDFEPRKITPEMLRAALEGPIKTLVKGVAESEELWDEQEPGEGDPITVVRFHDTTVCLTLRHPDGWLHFNR